MVEPFRVDPEALADAVQQMHEFQRYAESMLTEIDSLVTNLHATWSGEGSGGPCRGPSASGSRRGDDARGVSSAAGSGAGKAHANYTGAMAKNLGHVVVTRWGRRWRVIRLP